MQAVCDTSYSCVPVILISYSSVPVILLRTSFGTPARPRLTEFKKNGLKRSHSRYVPGVYYAVGTRGTLFRPAHFHSITCNCVNISCHSAVYQALVPGTRERTISVTGCVQARSYFLPTCYRPGWYDSPMFDAARVMIHSTRSAGLCS